MERKKIVGTPFKTAAGINVGYDINVDLNQNNKTLPTGEEIRIVSASEQFAKERNESTKYRLTANINPIIYYPQEYYWLGNLLNANFTFVTGATSTSQTNALATVNYDLPNILTLNGPNPNVENFEVHNKDNWVGQIIYPFQNEYTLKYNIPQFNANLAFSIDIEDARFYLDTGIDKLLYDKITDYLNLMNNAITPQDWFIQSNFIVQEPVEYNETLIISNQQFTGYVQDGIPFLFTVPLKTERGWFTAIYIPYEHNFEEGDYIFIKPIASTGYQVANNQYDTCDPSLYGFKRVIGTQWNSVLNNKGKHYVIIEHKSEYHDEWTNSPAPNSNSWKVVSSQGFIKKVKNYSDTGVLEISSEPLQNTTFTIQPEGTMVTLITEHGLKKEDDILLTLSEDAADTMFPNELRPLLYNLSGTYEVLDIVNDFSFIIRSTELADGIAYYDGQYTFATLPQATFITISKLNPYPSEYYLRRGKILTTINEFEVSRLPMSNSIFNDPNSNLVIEQDIDLKGLKDNLNRPISQLYLIMTKRAGKENYDFTDVESFFSWMFEYSQILVKTGDGLEIESKRCKETDDYVGYVKDVTGGWMEAYGEFLGDSYFIDFTEYNKADLQETKIEKLKHRFNTSYRECGNGICDEFLLDVTDDNFGGWSYYNGNTSNLTLGTTGPGNGATLTSSNSWVGPSENNAVSGNFIEQTFIVTPEYLGQELYMTFEYTQVTSTGIVKILDPGGAQVTTALLYPGDATAIYGFAQQGTYSAVFIPSTLGVYTILLGLSNFPETYDFNGVTYTTTTFEGKFSNLQILKYYGTPQYAGWVYDPFAEYTVRKYSQFIESADPNVLGIPDYATFIDGLWFWRDLLDVGYFEDTDFTIGVDYPFLNGYHYMDQSKNLDVGITPNRLGGTNGSGNGSTIFGCTDFQAANYNPFATVPCGDDPLQGGPCIPDALGVMQDLTNNPLGCCCFYESDPISSVDATKFAVMTVAANKSAVFYDYGNINSGYNRCYGRYPFWKTGTYFGSQALDHPLLASEISYDFYGVSVGVENPAARFARETGTARNDIFTFQNYGSTAGTILNFENNFGTTLGDGTGNDLYGPLVGQDQALADPDNEVFHPTGSEFGGDWGSTPSETAGENKLEDWPSSENIVWNGTSYVADNVYFNHSGILEFYKFDTSTCNTCFDKGLNSGTNDYFAPRHNWPLLDPLALTGGGTGTLDTFTNGNGVVMDMPILYKGMMMGKNAGMTWNPVRKFERGSNTPSPGHSINFSDWGSAGLIERDSTYGSFQTNIVAHRRPEDPDNWRFFYGQCSATWGCRSGSGNFGGGLGVGSNYPGEAPAGTSFGTIPNGVAVTDYTGAESQFVDFGFAECENSEMQGSAGETCRYCSCLVPHGGIDGGGASTLYGYDLGGNNTYGGFNFESNQPSYFAPVIPAGETHNYRFRGRVNIEMGINHNAFEFYYNSLNWNGGMQFAMSPEFAYTGGPPLTYLNPFWFPNSQCYGPTEWLQYSQWVAGEMSVSEAYLDYTRQYAGFWIAVVSETAKVTYIYDPDNGSSGLSSSPNPKQSQGPGGFNNVDWNQGCGGWKVDGVTQATNKMSYTPCMDVGGGPGTTIVGNCGIGAPNPCPNCSSSWNYVNLNFDCGDTDYAAGGGSNGGSEYYHPRYDRLVATGNYVPSCGEQNSGTDKGDFQKIFSQSFVSEDIPLKTGDKVFIYVKSINGAFKTNFKGGTEWKTNVGSSTGPIASGYANWDTLGTNEANHLPSYLTAQFLSIT